MKFKFTRIYPIIFILGLVCVFPNELHSQARIGDFHVNLRKLKTLDTKAVAEFKNKTVKFILPDFYPKSFYEEILKASWDISPFEVIITTGKEGEELPINDGDAIARFKSIKTSMDMPSGAAVHKIYHLIEFSSNKRVGKKRRWTTVAGIYFTPEPEIRDQVYKGKKNLKGDLLNFRPAYLEHQLRFVNNKLKMGESLNMYDNYVSPEIKKLKEATLYVDSNFIYTFDPFNAPNSRSRKQVQNKNGNDTSKKNLEDPKLDDLMEGYPYKYKEVEYEELEKMIFNDKSENFYYLTNNQINGNKIICIYSGKTGELVYQNHTKMSYNMKKKDFKQLLKTINKSK